MRPTLFAIPRARRPHAEPSSAVWRCPPAAEACSKAPAPSHADTANPTRATTPAATLRGATSMSAFTQLDYLELDDQYSEEELMVRDTVRSWISERFLPVVMEHFEKGTFPMELVPELADLGVFGPTTPRSTAAPG